MGYFHQMLCISENRFVRLTVIKVVAKTDITFSPRVLCGAHCLSPPCTGLSPLLIWFAPFLLIEILLTLGFQFHFTQQTTYSSRFQYVSTGHAIHRYWQNTYFFLKNNFSLPNFSEAEILQLRTISSSPAANILMSRDMNETDSEINSNCKVECC